MTNVHILSIFDSYCVMNRAVKRYRFTRQLPNSFRVKRSSARLFDEFITAAPTVPKNDTKVEVCVNEQPTIPVHVYTLGGSETTFHKIFTHIGGPKKPQNFLENWVLFTIVANGFR